MSGIEFLIHQSTNVLDQWPNGCTCLKWGIKSENVDGASSYGKIASVCNNFPSCIKLVRAMWLKVQHKVKK